jgi:hypothetical protein
VFVVDTNLLLYAVNPDSPDHAAARGLLERWRRAEEPWFVTWCIVYEFLRLATHAQVFPQPLDLTTARAWLDILLAAPHAGVLAETDRHGEVLRDTAASHPRLAGNIVHDFHTAVLMKEHGIEEIRTADTDFLQFRFLRVVNPLAPGSA